MAAQAHDDAPALRGVAFQEPVVSRPDAAFRNRKGRGPICSRSRQNHGRRRFPETDDLGQVFTLSVRGRTENSVAKVIMDRLCERNRQEQQRKAALISHPDQPWAIRVSRADSGEALDLLMDAWYKGVTAGGGPAGASRLPSHVGPAGSDNPESSTHPHQ